MRNVQSVINSISNVEVWANGATGLLNANSLNSLKTAVSGLSKEQALLVLSTKNLTQAQTEQVLVEAGIIASNDKINASIVQRALAESTLTAEQQKDILTKLELINVETGEVIATNACTKAALEEVLAKKGIVGADAEAIISSMGLTSANATQTISFDLLTASIWANIKALGKWLVTNPIGWAILGGTAIFSLVKAYDALTDSTEEVKERTDALLDSYNSAISEANSNAKTIESLASRYETLSKGVNNLGENVSLTADEYSEYNDIVNQIAEMFPTMIAGYTDEGNAILSLKGNVEELRDAYKEAQKEAYNLLIVSGKDSDGNDIITNYQNQLHGNESFLSTTSSYIDGEAGAKDAIDVITRLTGTLTPDEFRETYNQLYEEYENIWNSDKIQDALKSSGFEELTHTPKWSEITTEDLANVKYSAQATIQTYQAEIDSQLQNVRTLANAYLMTNSDYEKLDEQSKTAASLLVNSIDESIANGFENKSDVGAYVAELITSISNNAEAQKALTKLFTMDTTNMPVGEIQSEVDSYVSTIATVIGEDPVELKVRLGFDDTDTKPLIENVKKKLKGTEFDDKVGELNLGDLKIAADLEVDDDTIQSWDDLIERIEKVKSEGNETDISFIDVLNSEDNSKIKDELLELAKSGEITPETLSSTEEYAELLSKTETSAESATNQILDMLSAQEKLSGLSQGLDKLKTAYEEFKDEDIGFVTAEALSSLPDAFKNLPEFDLFSEIVGDPTSGVTAIQQAFNDIVKAYLLSQDTLQGLVGASEHDIQSYIANLKQMGITNAEEVVNLAVNALNTENELINAAQKEQEIAYQKYLKDKSFEYEKYLQSQSSQNTALVNALGETYKADYDNWCDLLSQKANAYNEFVKRIGGSYDAAYSATGNMAKNGMNMSVDNIVKANASASAYYQAQYEAERAKQQLKIDLAQISTDFGTSYSPASGSDKSSKDSSSKPSEVTQEFNWIEKYLESFARKTEKIMNRISDYLSFKKNLSTIKSSIQAVRSELSANEKALAEYERQMASVGLSQTYIDKIKNGELSIETITGYETDGNKDANAQLIEKIEKYQDLYDKYTEIEDSIEDLRDTEKEWLVKNLEYINEYYQKLSDVKNLAIDSKQDNIDLKEAQGKRVTTGDYSKLISNNEAYIKSLKTTYKKTNAEFNKLVKNGTIEKNSAEWFAWKESLADLNSEIVQAQINTAEWKDEINQMKIDSYTSSLDRLEAKYDKLNTTISRKESSNIIVTRSDYNRVLKNLDQQIAKNNKLLSLYKQLQSQTQKNSEKWREYQELIEQTEANMESLRDSIIETGQKMADIITTIRDKRLEDNENKSNLLSAKYDNATSATERNKNLQEQDKLAKKNVEINKKAVTDSENSLKQLDAYFKKYAQSAKDSSKANKEEQLKTSQALAQSEKDYATYYDKYLKAEQKFNNAKTKKQKTQAQAEMNQYESLMEKASATSAEYRKKLEDLANVDINIDKSLAQLDGYEFGKEIDLSQITDEDLLKRASEYNKVLENQKQAYIDVGLSEEEAIKKLRENASQRIQNCLDEYEALDKLNKAQRDNINSKISLNKKQGYTISDGEYETYIKSSQESIKLAQQKVDEAQAEFDKNLASGVYKDNEELYLKDKATLESARSTLYELWSDSESMLDEIMQLRIDALTEEKEALQKLYDLQQRRYKLEEAQYNLEKAKQRTNLVYNGEEFIYKEDTNALKDAEKALEDAKRDELIDKIDDWIDALEDAKEDFNLYDADGNPLGSTEDIIKAAKTFSDNLLEGLTRLFAHNNLEYSDGEIKQIQTFADGGVVGKSQDSKFDEIAKALDEDKLVAVKNGEMILTKMQGDELYKRLVGNAPVPVVNVKPVIPDNLVRVNSSPINVDMSGMQFHEVQNIDQFKKEMQKMAQKASSMIDMELGKRKM